jgi:hypothetical protein
MVRCDYGPGRAGWVKFLHQIQSALFHYGFEDIAFNYMIATSIPPRQTGQRHLQQNSCEGKAGAGREIRH